MSKQCTSYLPFNVNLPQSGVGCTVFSLKYSLKRVTAGSSVLAFFAFTSSGIMGEERSKELSVSSLNVRFKPTNKTTTIQLNRLVYLPLSFERGSKHCFWTLWNCQVTKIFHCTMASCYYTCSLILVHIIVIKVGFTSYNLKIVNADNIIQYALFSIITFCSSIYC